MKKQFRSQKISNTGDISPLPLPNKPKKRRKILIGTLAALLLAPVILLGAAVGIYAIWARGVKLDKSALPVSASLPTFYDADGNKLSYKQDSYISADEITDDLRNAFVAVEDKRFYSHKGYDPVRMAGAALGNLKAGGIREGASTITQQLVKNTQLTHERTLKRKLTEIALAAKLEREYSKDDILSMYLSVIYFGSGAYGVKQACRKFFAKDVGELTLSQCACLAGIVRNPACYSPKNKPENCVNRRDLVLKLMLEQGYIDDKSYEEATAEPLLLSENAADESAAYGGYLEKAAQEVCEALDITRAQLDGSGYRIHTALDGELQQELCALRGQCISAEDVDSAAVVLDSEGFAIGYSSNLPYEASRQAGSVLKPLAVYAPALNERMISLATPITDEKVNYGGYSPSNFGGKYYGDTTIKQAIARSMNSVSVKVLDYLGVDNCAAYLNKFGIRISDEDKNYALALGATSKGVSPLDIAAAYGAFARGGMYQNCKFVKAVIDGDRYVYDGKTGNPNGQNCQRAVSSATASLISVALKEAVTSGTAKTLSALPFEVAAKTGTAQREDGGNSDGWCASYNDGYTVVVWHGSDGNLDERGGGLPTMHALKIWQLLAARAPMPSKLTLSEDITQVRIDNYSAAKCRHAVAATDSTPEKYVSVEYFDVASLPTSGDSLFENVPAPQLSVNMLNDIVRLQFDCQPIYGYTLTRRDLLGESVIFECSGYDGAKTIYDAPVTFGGKVTYTLTCSSGSSKAQCTKTVFSQPPFATGKSAP